MMDSESFKRLVEELKTRELPQLKPTLVISDKRLFEQLKVNESYNWVFNKDFPRGQE